MPSQYLHSGEPLPLAPSLTEDVEQNIIELLNFHTKLLDYLRRLTAKLSSDIFSPPQITSVQSIALYLNGDFTPSGTDTIDWDRIIRMDSPFSYSLDLPLTGQITILEEGFYVSLLDIYAGDGNYTIQFKDGDDNTAPYGDGNIQISSGFSNGTIMVPFHLHKDQTIEVQLTSVAASVEALYSRWVMLKLGDFNTSGSGIDPCGLDIWQLCA